MTSSILFSLLRQLGSYMCSVHILQDVNRVGGFLNKMPTCPKCLKAYQAKHTCKAGHCLHCSRDFKSIGEHKCPIVRMRAVSPRDAWHSTIRHEGQACDGCHALYYCTKDERGLRAYKGAAFCADCYGAPEIEREKTSMMIQLTSLDIQMGRTACQICQKPLIHPQTGSALAGFRRVSVDVFSKECTVWALVANGSNFDAIREAHNKCCNLCIRCDSTVNKAKRFLGIQRLKTLHLTDATKRDVASKVARLAFFLVFQGSDTHGQIQNRESWLSLNMLLSNK
jgi:hypothetical protein